VTGGVRGSDRGSDRGGELVWVVIWVIRSVWVIIWERVGDDMGACGWYKMELEESCKEVNHLSLHFTRCLKSMTLPHVPRLLSSEQIESA
jgi:hypothetical protein